VTVQLPALRKPDPLESLPLRSSTAATLLALAQAPPWPAARTLALSGRCRYSVLGDWAASLERRSGVGAADRAIAALAAEGLALTRKSDASAWMPVSVQLRLTEQIVDLFHEGDRSRLFGAIADDVNRSVSRAGSLALRTLGARRLIEQIPRVHEAAYDSGRVDVSTTKCTARVAWAGAPFCEQPTWRLLQAAAFVLAFDLTRTPADIEIAELDANAMVLAARW
jgi:hypothetical protein